MAPHTAHDGARSFALANGTDAGLKLNGSIGALCDIAPTLCCSGMESPKEFTGRSCWRKALSAVVPRRRLFAGVHGSLLVA